MLLGGIPSPLVMGMLMVCILLAIPYPLGAHNGGNEVVLANYHL
jgi:hypothetical protein